MEILSDLAKIFGRIITILPLMLLVALFMGRRSVGELPVFDFLIVISLGAVVGADIADPQINHIHTAFAIIVIGLLQRGYSELAIRNTKFRKLTTFDPVVVIKEGKFIVNNLKSVKYSVDNVLELLRENGVFSVDEVDLALIEANGQISIYKKPEKLPVTPKDLGLPKPKSEIAYPVIIEGNIYNKVLTDLNLNEKWLYNQLKIKGFNSAEGIFLASIDKDNQLHISSEDAKVNKKTPIYH